MIEISEQKLKEGMDKQQVLREFKNWQENQEWYKTILKQVV